MIKTKRPTQEVILDTTGPEGNAFVIKSRAIQYAEELGYSKDEIDQLKIQIKDIPYVELLAIFERHFGDYVVLVMDECLQLEVNKELHHGQAIAKWLK